MQDELKDINFKNLFTPLTNKKAILWIIAIGFIVFFNALFNGFVWDDKGYIINNPELHQINFTALIKNNSFVAGGYYRPVTAIYFSLLYSLFNNNPFFYHLSSVIIHIINSLLVFIFLKKFFKDKISLICSIIFLIHPMQVEAVSYIAAAADPIFFIFGISALLLSTKEKISFRRYVAVFLLLILSIFTKETGVLFFIITLLYRAFFRKRYFFYYLSYALLLPVLYFLVRFKVSEAYFKTQMFTSITRLSLGDRLLNIPEIFFYYIKTFFFPAQLVINQLWLIKNTNFYNFWRPLTLDSFIIFLIIFFGIYIYNKKNKIFFFSYLFFSLWFLIGISILLQIFPLDMTVAERWFYFPMVGLLGVVAVGLEYISESKKILIKYLTILAAIVIILLSLRTIIRNTSWKDPISLYEHDSKILDNFDIENNLGSEYMAANDYQNSLVHFKKSVELFPYETNLFNLGSTYENMKKIDLAKKYYLMAINSNHFTLIPHKHIFLTYERLGYVLLLDRDFKLAKKYMQIGANDYPEDANVWIILAVSEYNLNEKKNALVAAEKAKSIYLDEHTNYIYNQIVNNQPIQISP